MNTYTGRGKATFSGHSPSFVSGAIQKDAPSGLNPSTTYYFKINGTEHSIITGSGTVTYQNVVDLMNAAVGPNFFATTEGTGNFQDIIVYDVGVKGYGSIVQLDHGTTGLDLFTHLYFWSSFRKAPVFPKVGPNSLFGTVVASDFLFTKLTDPAILPASAGNGVKFSYDVTYMTVVHNTTPYVTIYKRSGDTFTKLGNPTVLPTGAGNGVSWSSDGTYMAVAHSVSPYITIYKRSGDTFTKLANPGTLPAGDAFGCSFSLDTTYLSVAHNNSPYITIYKRSGDTFTKLGNPSTLLTANGRGTAFSSDNTYLGIVGAANLPNNNIIVYKRSGDTFSVVYQAPSASDVQSCAFSQDVLHFGVSIATTPFVGLLFRTGDVFTQLVAPNTFPTSSSQAIAFNQANTLMATAVASTPYIVTYLRASNGYFKKANPATLPTGLGRGIGFSFNNVYLAIAHDTSPYVTVYKITAVLTPRLYGAAATSLAEGSPSFYGEGLTVFYGDSNFYQDSA